MDIGSIGLNMDVYRSAQMQSPPKKPDIEEMTDRLIQDKDEDGSGGLSIDELHISEEAFAKADADGNGELDSEELIANAEIIGKELGPPPKPGDTSQVKDSLIDLLSDNSEETGVNLIA